MGRKGESRQQRGSFWSRSRIALALAAVALIVTGAIVSIMAIGGGTDGGGEADAGGGTGGKSPTAQRIRPEWIDTAVMEVGNDTVYIPASEVVDGRMLHFTVPTGQGVEENFMAYNLDGQTHVRANVCPPCRSVGFSLSGDILVCDSCGTRFSASTGDGISGACRDFPKAAVAYAISGDQIAMDLDNLVAAYENTEKPGWP